MCDNILELLRVKILESSIKVMDNNVKEMGIFLRKMKTTDELKSKGILDYIPIRKKNKNIKDKKKTDDLLDESPNIATDEVVKIMWMEILVTSVKLVMKNHSYKFDKEIRVQTDEGSIGLKITGVLVEIEMLI